MVPNRAVAALIRPPRFRWFRSSTVNQWQTLALGLLGKGLHLVDGLPLFLLLRAEIHEQSLPQRGAEGVHRQDLRVREIRPSDSSAAMTEDW